MFLKKLHLKPFGKLAGEKLLLFGIFLHLLQLSQHSQLSKLFIFLDALVELELVFTSFEISFFGLIWDFLFIFFERDLGVGVLSVTFFEFERLVFLFVNWMSFSLSSLEILSLLSSVESVIE